jgi:hypothetical protein
VTTVFGYEQMLSQARDIDKLYEGRELQGQVVATLCEGGSSSGMERLQHRRAAGAS